MKGGSKDYWFILTAESLSWYKDEEVCECVCLCGSDPVCVSVSVCLGERERAFERVYVCERACVCVSLCLYTSVCVRVRERVCLCAFV